VSQHSHFNFRLLKRDCNLALLSQTPPHTHTHTLLLGVCSRWQDAQYTRSYCSPQLTKEHLFSHTKTSTRTLEFSKLLKDTKSYLNVLKRN